MGFHAPRSGHRGAAAVEIVLATVIVSHQVIGMAARERLVAADDGRIDPAALARTVLIVNGAFGKNTEAGR
jgi:hypothetical protein